MDEDGGGSSRWIDREADMQFFLILEASRVRNPQSNLSMGSSKRPCHVYREAIVTSHIRASVSPKRVKILCQCAHPMLSSLCSAFYVRRMLNIQCSCLVELVTREADDVVPWQWPTFLHLIFPQTQFYNSGWSTHYYNARFHKNPTGIIEWQIEGDWLHRMQKVQSESIKECSRKCLWMAWLGSSCAITHMLCCQPSPYIPTNSSPSQDFLSSYLHLLHCCSFSIPSH